MPIPQRPGASWVAYLHWLALPADPAGTGTGTSHDDLHQRALAGAVLTEQGVDLAGVDAYRSMRPLARQPDSAFADPAQFGGAAARRRVGANGGPGRLLDDATAGAKYLARGQEVLERRLAPGSHGPGCCAERHPAGARLGRRGTFVGKPAAHPAVEHLSQNSHHQLLPQSYPQRRSPSGTFGKPPAPIVPAIFNIGDGQKTANPAGHGLDLARHFFQHFANSFIHKISDSRSEEHGRTISPVATGRPESRGAPPAARFQHSLPNSFSIGGNLGGNGNARENVPGTSPLDAKMPMDTGFSGFPGKVRGDRRKHARRRLQGWIRCP